MLPLRTVVIGRLAVRHVGHHVCPTHHVILHVTEIHHVSCSKRHVRGCWSPHAQVSRALWNFVHPSSDLDLPSLLCRSLADQKTLRARETRTHPDPLHVTRSRCSRNHRLSRASGRNSDSLKSEKRAYEV